MPDSLPYIATCSATFKLQTGQSTMAQLSGGFNSARDPRPGPRTQTDKCETCDFGSMNGFSCCGLFPSYFGRKSERSRPNVTGKPRSGHLICFNADSPEGGAVDKRPKSGKTFPTVQHHFCSDKATRAASDATTTKLKNKKKIPKFRPSSDVEINLSAATQFHDAG